MRVLVTGASGAIGADLIPMLVSDGYTVRAFGRNPARIPTPGIVEVVPGDAVTGEGLEAALCDVDVAYFLIHSMETVIGDDASYADRDRSAAQRFTAVARAAGVRRVVYLGGLVPDAAPASPHLASRLEVEETLLNAAPEAVALRASIVIGARSRSFRLLVRLIERLPFMALPAWRTHRTRPIDARDIVALLHAAGTSTAIDRALSLDAVGPDIVTYAELIERISDALLVRRPRVDLPVTLTPIASRLTAAVADEDPTFVEALMGSLTADLLPRAELAAQVLGVRVHRLDAAIERALGDWERDEDLGGR